MSVFQLERDGDIEGLVEALHRSSNPSVRSRAAEALGGFEEANGRVVDPLVRAAVDDDHEAVRAAAIDALDEQGQEALERVLLERADFDSASQISLQAFIDQLDAEQAEIRMAAAYAVGRRGEPRAIPSLMSLVDDSNPRVRARAIRACGMIGDPRALGAVRSARSDENEEVRKAAAFALGQYSGSDALESLVELLDDPSETVRREVAIALGEFPDLQPVDAVTQALADDFESVRQSAVYSMIELLANAPTDRSHEIRETVVDVLNESNEADVIETLAEVLEESTQPLQRRNSAWLLGRMDPGPHEERVVSALVDRLVDDDDLTSQFAATSLASIGGDVVEEALIEELDRTSGSRKATLVFTLGKIGGEQARQRIDRLIEQTENDEVREKAFAAMSRLGGR